MAEAGDILGVDRRKALLTLAAALVLVAGVAALVGKAADYGRLLEAVRRADRSWFLACLGGIALAYAGYVLAYRDVARARGGPRFGYWTVIRVVAVGFGAHVVGSAVGGLAVDFWALTRAGEGVHESARRVLGLNTLEWAVLGALAAVAAALVLAGAGEAPLAMTLSWLAGVPASLAAAAWLSSPRRAGRFADLAARKPGRLGGAPRAWARWVGAKLRKGIADAVGGLVVVRHLLARPHRHPGGVLGFPLFWLGHMTILYAGVRAFTGGHTPPAALVLAFATGYVATALPLPGGGSGGIEAAMTYALHAVGVALAPALLGVLLYRVFSFWLPIAPALAFLPLLRGLSEDLPRSGRDARAGA